MVYTVLTLEPVEKGSTPHGFLRNFIKELDRFNTFFKIETDGDFFSVTNNLPLDNCLTFYPSLFGAKDEIETFKNKGIVMDDSLYYLFYGGKYELALDCMFIYADSSKVSLTEQALRDLCELKDIPICNLADPVIWNEISKYLTHGGLACFIEENLK